MANLPWFPPQVITIDSQHAVEFREQTLNDARIKVLGSCPKISFNNCTIGNLLLVLCHRSDGSLPEWTNTDTIMQCRMDEVMEYQGDGYLMIFIPSSKSIGKETTAFYTWPLPNLK